MGTLDRRFVLFIACSILILVGHGLFQYWRLSQKPPASQEQPATSDKVIAALRDEEQNAAVAWLGCWPGPGKLYVAPVMAVPKDLLAAHKADKLKEEQELAKRRQAEEQELAKRREAERDQDIVLGDVKNDKGYKLRVLFSRKHAAIRAIYLNEYQVASQRDAKPDLDRGKTLILCTDDGKEDPEHLSFRFLIRIAENEPPPVILWNLERASEQEVVFRGVIQGKNVTVTRTFRLKPGEYHVGMELAFARNGSASDLVYEITGPRGVPVEGEIWSQGRPTRRVVIGAMDIRKPGNVDRLVHEPKPIKKKKLQENFLAEEHLALQYAGVTSSYFAALVVVDGDPTQNQYFQRVETDYEPYFDPDKPDLMGNMRLVSRPLKLKAEDNAAHKFFLYAGPAKVRLLAYEGAPELADFYGEERHLRMLTDYSEYPRVFGWWWTPLVVLCTNFMHWLLEMFHKLGAPYWLAIILLTVVVRVVMLPLSWKQALMAQRMQKLHPELKKLQEKYKTDRQAMAQAQMELYRKSGVNPLSGCLPAFIQMPIFMGLYYALSESVHLRLAAFLWIDNLAAPDMLFAWDHWPLFGPLMSLIRMGPYFHLLPVIAVALLIVQQKLYAPPALDEQGALQMKVMNYMMFFIGYMFYWVAAGLALYFCVSWGWGLVERRLLPKAQHAAGKDKAEPPPPAGPKQAAAAATARPVAQPAKGTPSPNGESLLWLRRLGAKVRQLWTNLLKRADERR